MQRGNGNGPARVSPQALGRARPDARLPAGRTSRRSRSARCCTTSESPRVPERILNKPGPLTAAEWEELKDTPGRLRQHAVASSSSTRSSGRSPGRRMSGSTGRATPMGSPARRSPCRRGSCWFARRIRALARDRRAPARPSGSEVLDGAARKRTGTQFCPTVLAALEALLGQQPERRQAGRRAFRAGAVGVGGGPPGAVGSARMSSPRGVGHHAVSIPNPVSASCGRPRSTSRACAAAGRPSRSTTAGSSGRAEPDVAAGVRVRRGRRRRRAHDRGQPRRARPWRIVPRVLRDVSDRDLSVELFGRRLPTPFLLAPIGVLELAHQDADVAVAKAAAAEGVPMIFSNQASRPMEECAEAMGDGAALVPALLEHVGRAGRELRRAGRGVRVRGDRRHPRHEDARLAVPRPRLRAPAVRDRQGDRAVHERPRLPRHGRSATAGAVGPPDAGGGAGTRAGDPLVPGQLPREPALGRSASPPCAR